MDFHKLLLLTLDIEGAIRVLEACDSPEGRENLSAKVAALNEALAGEALPKDDAEAPTPREEEEAVVPAEEAPAPIEEPKPAEETPAPIEESTHIEYVPFVIDETPIVIEEAPVVIEDEPAIMEEEPAVEHEEPIAEVKVTPQTPVRPNAELIKAFTVNDRYRFAAELFNGDSDDFNETVKLLASMPDMAEVEDFLYGDLLWDASNPVVEEFLGIVRQYIPQ